MTKRFRVSCATVTLSGNETWKIRDFGHGVKIDDEKFCDFYLRNNFLLNFAAVN